MTYPRSAIWIAALLAGGAFAQTAPRSVQPAAPAVRATPATPSAPAVAPGAPSAAGLTSPSPFPQGLPSPQPFPGGVPSTAILPPGTPVPGTAPSTVTDPGLVVPQPQAAVVGAGTPGGPQNVPAGPSGYSALQIAQSFRQADANLNGELTRAEAQRLSIMPYSFEEMDRNKDGVLSRSEYEDGVR